MLTCFVKKNTQITYRCNDEHSKNKKNKIFIALIGRFDKIVGKEKSDAPSFGSFYFTVPLFAYISSSNDALACVCSTLILIQFGWNGSFRQLSAAMAPDGFLASSAGIRD